MPVVNSSGHIIEELDAADSFRQFTQRLRQLKYPRDLKTIKRLSYQLFCYWIYGLDPKEALFLTNTPEFRKLQDKMRHKNYFRGLYDYVWRVWHGFNL